MANKEQVEKLKQGVERWNKWRMENPGIKIDLSGANLTEGRLGGGNLRKANLSGTNLSGAFLFVAYLQEANLSAAVLWGTNLAGADLRSADLSRADLSRANLSGANLSRANLKGADLLGADLKGALLSEVNFRGANLWAADFKVPDLHGVDFTLANLRGVDFSGANLRGAKLDGANLTEVGLINADLADAVLESTTLDDIDLSETKGLDDVIHQEPSQISTSTLRLSKGKIPEKFLRGCGLSDVDIAYAKLANPELGNHEINEILYKIYDLRANRAIQINPLFISYSHADNAFVNIMEKHLDEKGIRFWRDIHDATSGRLEKVVDRAIRQNPIVLLILSEHSVKSDWVEHEARTARELEKELERDVLCPVALDDAWKECKWPVRLREQIMEYHILDFSKWQDEGEFGKMFRKLVAGLDLFYKEG